MGQASWPKSSRKGIGVYTPTIFLKITMSTDKEVVGRINSAWFKYDQRGPKSLQCIQVKGNKVETVKTKPVIEGVQNVHQA